MAEDVLPLFLDSSTDRQKLLKVVPGGLGLAYQDAKGEHFAGLMKSGVITLMANPQSDMEDLAEKIANKATAAMVERLERMERMIKELGEQEQ